MHVKSLRYATCLSLVLMAVMIAGCFSTSSTSDGDGGGGGGLFSTTAAVYIFASWSGGATGAPTDRTATEPGEGQFEGRLCPANSIVLENDVGGFDGLTITNNCSIGVSLGLCVTKGSLAQPDGGLNQCATDPLQTPFADLKFHPIIGGPGAEDYRNASENLSVNVFYCSDGQELCGPPICNEISCLVL